MLRHVIISLLILLNFFQFTQAQNLDSLVGITIEKAEVFRKKEKNYKKAIDTLESLLVQLEKENIYNDLVFAPLFHKIGLNYYKYGNQSKAKFYVSKALAIRQKKYGKLHVDVARAYFLRAAIYKEMKYYNIAQKDINHAITSMEALILNKLSTDTLRLIRMYDEAIRINIRIKNNSKALFYWEKSYFFYKKNKFKTKTAYLFEEKGRIFFNQKKYRLAEKYFLEALKIYRILNKDNEGYTEYLATTYSNLSFAQSQLKRYNESMENSLQAITLFKQAIDTKDSPWLNQKIANAYCNLIELSNITKQYPLSQKYFQKSLEHNLKGWSTIYHPRFAELYRNKTQTHLNQKQYPEALQSNHKALHALLPTFTTKNIFDLVYLNTHSIKDKISFLATIKQKAEVLTTIYEAKGKKDIKYLKAVFRNYQTLDTVITQIRQGYAQGSQFELIEQSYPIYEKAIGAGIQLFEKTGEEDYLEAAYYFAAKNKALVLLGGMQEEEAKSFSSIPVELLDKEKSLKQAIFQLESKLYEQGESEDKAVLKDSLFTLRRNHQKLINRFEEEYGDYFDAKYGFDKRIEITALQQKLHKEACIMEYFVGDEQLFVFIITKTEFDYVAMDKPEAFEKRALSFRENMESQAALSDDFGRQSNQLFKWVLAEGLAKAEKNGAINHLIIIPDGILMQLPFDVLLQEETGKKYVIRDYSISYAYSNRLLFSKSKHRRAKNIFGGFGLEYDKYTLANLETYVDNPLTSLPLSRALGHLQYSDDEIVEIAELLHGKKWLNAAATRESFLENADQFSILHLATHGIINEEYPMNSALVFTRQNDSTEYFLRAADLYGLQLNADMAVLSACNTGAGIVNRGEGVRSLARAFSFAGCPSLIASLWSASDKSTKDILVNFYKNLKKGMSKNEAMRQAKLTYLDNAPPAYQSPYYWSHLSVIGDSRELAVLITPVWKKYWVWGAVILFILGGLVYRKRNQAA